VCKFFSGREAGKFVVLAVVIILPARVPVSICSFRFLRGLEASSGPPACRVKRGKREGHSKPPNLIKPRDGGQTGAKYRSNSTKRSNEGRCETHLSPRFFWVDGGGAGAGRGGLESHTADDC